MANSRDDHTIGHAQPAGGYVAGWVLAILLTVAVAYYAAFHARFLTLPGPQEARESAIPLTTGLMLAGGRPYTLATEPAVTNVYGIVYNYALLPAAKIWGSTFFVHRVGSLVFLLAGASLLCAMLLKDGVGRALALAGAVFYYLINTTTYDICARPDTLGSALMLAALWLVMPGRNGQPASWAKLGGSVLLGVLAFYTKPYFVFALPLAAAALLLTGGLKRALPYAAGAAALGLASLPVVNHIWPYYIFSIYTTHLYPETTPPIFFSYQLHDFLELHAGLLAAAAVLGAGWLIQRSKVVELPVALAWRRWQPTPAVLQLLMAVAAMLFILGNHDGAFRIYWVQLVTPFLLLTVLSGLARSGGRIRALALGLLAVNVVILLTWMRPPWPQDSAPAWQAWQTLTAGKPWQLLPYGMLPDVPPAGASLVDNGQTSYFANLALEQLRPDDPAYLRVMKYLRDVHAYILQRRFDVIAGPNDFRAYVPDQLLRDHYEKRELSFPMYFFHYLYPHSYGSDLATFDVWLRKPGPEHAFVNLPPSLPPMAAPLKPAEDQ